MWVIKVTDWKTIAARISRAKTGDEEATAEERSNASKAYESVGIDVYNQDGSYRGLNTILDELADKWDTLTDAQKNYIAEQSAGVRNINVFNTMLDTWGEAQTIANEAIEDSGYYLEVQEKHMESMQAKLNQLQAQWQEFWYNLIDTNAVNLVIDFLQNLVKLASAVVDGFSAIGSVFGETGGAIGGIAGAIGIVLTAASAWTSFQKGLKDSEGGVFKSTFAGFSGMFEDIKKLGTTAKTTFDIFKSGMSDGVDGTKGLIGGIKAVTNTLTKTELAFLKVGLAIAAIGVAVKVFDVLTISSEEAAENAKKVAEEYQKVQKTLNDNKKVIDSVSDEYQILSEGVDLSNNKNISLTTDEYNRYLDICNQIAGIYPSLVNSYDEQGNAILKLKGKVAALNEEYEKERLNAARANVNNLGEYTEDFKNKTGNRSDLTYFADSWNDWGDADVGGRLTEGDAARILENVSNMTLEEFNAHLKDLGSRKQSDASAGDELSYLLGDNVLNIGFWDRIGGNVQVTEDQFKSMRQKISSLIPGYAATVNDSAAQVKSAMQSLLLTMQLDEETYGDFINLDSNVFNQISGMFNNMTSEQIEELFGDSEDIEFAIKTYMYDFVKAINDTPDAQVGLSNLLNIDDDATIEEMAKVISDNLPSLAKLLGYEGEGEIAQLVEQLGLTETKELVDGFDEDVEDINKSLNKTNKENKEQVKYHEKIKKFIKDEKINTKSELALLKQCAATSETWAETMHNFSLTNIDVNINDEELSNLKSNLIIVNETIDKIDEATQASYSSKGLTSEQIENIKSAFSDLKDEAGKALFDYDKLFESSAEGVRLNAQELDRLNGLYEEAERNKYDKKLEELQDQYARTCIAIDKAVTSTEKYELINRRDYLLKQIQQAQELKSQYEGLTNAVTKYQRAKELGEEGDTYLSLVEDKETIEELYNSGEVGTNQFKAAVQMMTNKDMSGASVAEYLDVYQTKWAQFSSWLTEDASGLQTFLYDLKDLGMASVDENGFWSIDGDIEEMANGLGTSQAIIQEIFKRLKDFGFDVDFREETDHLKALREEAEKLREGVSEEYKLDLTVKGEDAIDAQIKKGEELLKELDSESEAYKSLRTQVNYLRAVAGQTADALNFKLNYNDNKDEINGLITKLKSIEAYKDIYINFENVNITNVDGQIDNVTSKLDALRDPEIGKINFSAPGATELSDILIALNNKKIELSSTSAILKLDSNNFEEGYSSAITQIKDVKANMDELARTEVEIELGVEGAEEKAETLKSTIQTQLDEINKGENKVLVDLGMSNVTQENFQTLLDGITANKLVDVEFPLTEEDKATLGYIESDITKEVDGDFTKINQKLSELDKDIARVRTMTFQASGLSSIETRVNAVKNSLSTINVGSLGGSRVDGTAHAQGTAHSTLLQKGLAFAKGTWGAAKSGMSLVGELGREIIVRGNRFFTVGDNGAEMFPVKKGDIIFNHKQSRELLEHGYVTSGNGRGDMVGGDAFAQGTAYNTGVSGSFTTTGALQGANKFYNDALTFASGEGMDEDEFKEVMDWVEIMIDRLERKIEDLDTVASSSYKKWITRNKTLVSEFGKVTEEIELQQKAYNTYLARAESVALSEEYKQKVRDGKLQIEDITDEDLKEKIDDYQEWYEKALDCSYAITDLKEQLAELTETKFNNVVDEFEAMLSIIEHTTDSIDTALSIVEAKGNFASEKYFQNLMSTEKENISMLQKEYAALLYEFEDAMATGTIQEGSEAFYSMKEQIREVESALQDANLALIEYRNDMWEMDWSVFEKQLEYIEEITKESEFLVNLLSHNENDLFGEKNGKLTDSGFAVGGLHAVDYNVYMAEAQKYAEKVKEINAELAKDPTNTILLDKKNEYLEAQREAISNANDEKLAIRDLIEESYNRMLEILQELIDKRKEALQAEKD